MANQEQIEILKQGVEVWNKWREKNPDQLIDLEGATLYGQTLSHANFRESNLRRADLSGAKLDNTNFYLADLRQANLAEADLTWANLGGAKLNEANLHQVILTRADVREADLTNANLSSADLREALLYQTNFHRAILTHANLSKVDIRESNLSQAKLSFADMQKARLDELNLSGAECILTNLSFASLYKADLREADLRETDLGYARLGHADIRKARFFFANLCESDLNEADLSEATLIYSNLAKSNITNARISRCRVYGVIINDIVGEFKEQDDLVITFEDDSTISVDNIFVAHFVSQTLKRKEFRDVFESWASKVVLLIGRFDPPKRNVILEVLKSELREYNLVPLVYHLNHPDDLDFIIKVKLLAGISCFVIIDVTNPRSSLLKMTSPMPQIQAPIVPIIQQGESQITMFADLHEACEFVLDTVSYNSMNELMKKIKPNIIGPAIGKSDELRLIKAKTPTVIANRKVKVEEKKFPICDVAITEVPLTEALVLRRQYIHEVYGPSPVVMTNVPHLVIFYAPTGYSFGYHGKGPLDLALNICEWYLLQIGYHGQRIKENTWASSEKGDYFQLSFHLHEEFWSDFIEKVPDEGIIIPFADLKKWFDNHI